MSVVKQYRDWKRQHPDFPLTVNPNGQWSKKVRGKVYYFGRLEDPDGALREWLEDKDYFIAGVEPPTWQAGITVKELCGQHLDCIDGKIKAGKMAPATRREYVTAGKVLTGAGLYTLAIDQLTPSHFMDVIQLLDSSDRRIRTQKNVITAIKTIFKWGAGMELFDSPVRFGMEFKTPSIQDIEAEQEKIGLSRFHERETILKMLIGYPIDSTRYYILWLSVHSHSPTATRCVQASCLGRARIRSSVICGHVAALHVARTSTSTLWPSAIISM